MNGEISFKEALIKRTKMLKGIKESKIKELIKDIKIYNGVKSVIRTMNKFGSHTILISGGYNIIAEIIAKEIGFKEVVSNTLEIKNNFLTGKLENKIIDKRGKLNILKKRIIKFAIPVEKTLAVGDGDNDIDIIKFAGTGVAWRAYPKVKKAADVEINKKFKSILYFQGYKDKEIIK